jgi:hypothetical protein
MHGTYGRAYDAGIIHEPKARAQLDAGAPAEGFVGYAQRLDPRMAEKPVVTSE